MQPALGFAGEIWVRLVARDASGSMDSVLMRFPYYPEGADLLPDTVIGCPDQPASITAPFGMDQYLWSTGATTQTVAYGGYGPLVLYATSDSCAYTDTVWVVSANPLPRVLPWTILVCDSSYVAEIGEFTGVDSLAWRGPDSTRGVAVPSAVGGFSMAWDRPGDYILEKFDANGCLTYERVELKLNPPPLIRFAGTCPDYWVWLQDVASVSEFRVDGRIQSVDSVLVSFDFDGVYLLEAVIEDLCGQTDTIYAQLPYFCTGRDLRWVPNAFTPNGDGDNDAFCLNTSYGDALRYAIYNRWGGLEFEGQGTDCWEPP
ncbi:MAG: hypothetical protein EBZ31_01285, partial [Flavobacteriia bacterium]|nr:hypothetical protein [Flavobacteriia bacterium]